MAAKSAKAAGEETWAGVGGAGGHAGWQTASGARVLDAAKCCAGHGVCTAFRLGPVTASLGASPSTSVEGGWRYPPPRTVGSP